jgi:hypothetical protein
MFMRMILTAMLIAAIPTAANAQLRKDSNAEVEGYALGYEPKRATGGTVLFSAKSAVISAVDPMRIKQFSHNTCFHVDPNGGNGKGVGVSLGELFSQLEKNQPSNEKRTILQIMRVPTSNYPQCAAIWFTYVEK